MNVRYEIRIRGLLGPLLRRTFGSMSCEALPCQSTIRGKLSAEELEKLLTRLDESGIELVYLDAGPG
jgi:hypothetical protein